MSPPPSFLCCVQMFSESPASFSADDRTLCIKSLYSALEPRVSELEARLHTVASPISQVSVEQVVLFWVKTGLVHRDGFIPPEGSALLAGNITDRFSGAN